MNAPFWCLVAAFVCFALAALITAVGGSIPRVHLIAIGLALYVLSSLVHR